MVSACLELLSLGMCIGGTLLGMVACGLPTWKVSAFIESNIVVSQSICDGLWMSCVVQSTGQIQCKMHDSMLALTKDLQVARALTVISSVIGMVGLIVTLAGAQCTNCVKTQLVKARIVKAGGLIYIVSGLVILVPLCWMANNIIADFYNPQIPPANKREIGAAIYIGWAASALLLLGGSMFCLPCPASANSSYSVKYASPKSATENGDYDKKNYV
ncbi:claudin-5-like [Megalops cyprinoides]|uniref:claudin-5-like n=1 Tax=Megalops cyprinoides TaxID=118141 RepID=UPI001864F804|nr:claudin-5-like [Megalops cyprinoides]